MWLNITCSVVGGVLTLGLVALAKRVRWQATKRAIRQVFGGDITGPSPYHIVYAEFVLPKEIKGITLPTHPFKKPGHEESGISFSISKPVSLCEVRASTYLVEHLNTVGARSIVLSSDSDLSPRLDTSFIALGSPQSNYKTRDAVDNDGNKLIKLDKGKFTAVESGKQVLVPQPKYDYGLILKTRPREFPARTWLVCAGVDEWGTSGATWYLARKWRVLRRWAGDSAFAVIVRVTPGQDESAVPVVEIRSPEDVLRYETDS